LLIFGLIIVPGFTADMNQGSSGGKTFGCGSAGPVSDVDLDDWDDDDDCLESDNAAQVYFEQADPSYEGKNHKDAWGKMCYTFCGEFSQFVFNGHGLERNGEFQLFFEGVMPGMGSTPTIISDYLGGPTAANNGGNVHIKGDLGDFEGELQDVQLYLLDASSGPDYGTTILVAQDVISYTTDCLDLGQCEERVFSANLTANGDSPESMDGPFGSTVFVVSDSGEEIYYKLMADGVGTAVNEAFVGDEIGNELAPIYPDALDLDLGGHDLLAVGVINSEVTADVLGSDDPISALIDAFEAGSTAVYVLDAAEIPLVWGTIYPADCDDLFDLWNLHQGIWDDDVVAD
jgi:hypothetical protein